MPLSPAGTWTNEYGSMMTLDVEGHRVQGTYQSSTGSTGKYRVTGFQADAAVEEGHGLPVSLAIEWHSVSEGAPDPSWNWSSGLCGQVLADAQGDRLVLQHLLVATSDFPNLAEKGIYVDKLVYRRVAHAAAAAVDTVADVATETDDALSGIWRSIDGMELTLRVYPDENHAYGAVEGELSFDQGTFNVSGFTDINARADGLVLQSLSLTAAGKTAWSFSGSVALGQDRMNVQLMSASSTAPTSSYVQTRIESMTFSRYIESNEI